MNYQNSKQHIENTLAARKLGLIKIEENKQLRIYEYYKNPKLCEKCNKSIDYDKKRNRFCSSTCSASHNNVGRIRTAESKAKMSRIMKEAVKPYNRIYRQRKYVTFNCKWCKKDFESYAPKKGRVYCSITCRRAFQTSPEGRLEGSAIAKKMAQTDVFKGWTQLKFEASYPEKYFMEVLTNANINYDFNLKVGRYFIDFALSQKMIALEIDGKQHKRKDRMEADKRKDEFLTRFGWTVYRIDWYNPAYKNKDKLYSQILEFKKYYESMPNKEFNHVT